MPGLLDLRLCLRIHSGQSKTVDLVEGGRWCLGLLFGQKLLSF